MLLGRTDRKIGALFSIQLRRYNGNRIKTSCLYHMVSVKQYKRIDHLRLVYINVVC